MINYYGILGFDFLYLDLIRISKLKFVQDFFYDLFRIYVSGY